MKKIGKINQKKGSDAEKHYAELFVKLGYQNCKISSIADKKMDNAKIDLTGLPFNLQIKSGRQKNLSPGKELLIMKGAIQSMFPSTSSTVHLPNILLHTYSPENEDKIEHVYMTLQTFNMFKIKNPKLKFDSKKEFKFNILEEFKTIVKIEFKYFIEQILFKKYF